MPLRNDQMGCLFKSILFQIMVASLVDLDLDACKIFNLMMFHRFLLFM